MILLWDVDSGLAQLDKYFHSTDTHVIAGALLGVGIVNCGIKNDCDPVSFHIMFYLMSAPFPSTNFHILCAGIGTSC